MPKLQYKIPTFARRFFSRMSAGSFWLFIFYLFYQDVVEFDRKLTDKPLLLIFEMLKIDKIK